MVSFIFVEPSCDIHLTTDESVNDSSEDKRQVELKVFKAKTASSSVDHAYEFSLVKDHLSYDVFPIDQTVVDFEDVLETDDAGNVVTKLNLVPLSVGTVLMQIRYDDPDRSSEHHYILVRIQVHQTIQSWWFGNDSLSVYLDSDLAHSQVSLYALFDHDEDNQDIVADITGHGYVNLSSEDETICKLDRQFNKNQYRDRIRGLSTNHSTHLVGNFLGQQHRLPIEVILN